MFNHNEKIGENLLRLKELDINFSTKPVIVGGLAMEYYGLRKHGKDIDMIVTEEDYQMILKKYPLNRKDSWGDLGFLIGEYEIFRSIWKYGHDFFSENAVEFDTFKVVSFERLFMMKVLAMYADDKHKNDVQLILRHYEQYQNPVYRKYMNDHIDSYLAAPDGIIFNSEF